MMHLRIISLATAAHLLGICTSVAVEQQHQQFYRWNQPLPELGVYRRQGPLPGYHPEFGTCGSGTTCENACGQNWESCKASTSLSLFCYNKVELGQTCCENGSGRACERGYYCAWKEFGGKTWCCKNGQSVEECRGDVISSSSSLSSSSSTTSHSLTLSGPTSSTSESTTHSSTSSSTTTESSSTTSPQSRPPVTPTSCPPVSVVTATSTKTLVVTQSGGGRTTDTVTSTVTVTIEEPRSIVTVSVFSTISVTVTNPGTTVTVPRGTITIPGGIITITAPGDCSSSSSTAPPPPPPPPPPPQSSTPCSTSTPAPPPPPPPPPVSTTPCETTTPIPPTEPTHPYIHHTTKVSTVTTEVPCSTTDKPRYHVEITPSACNGSSEVSEPSVTSTTSIVTAGASGNDLPKRNGLVLCLALVVLGVLVS
ncbi:hypothetical protein V8F06_007597 [Rhypophila decipiens]